MCSTEPKTVEVLFNSYTHIPVTCRWEKTIPAQTLQVEKIPHSPKLYLLSNFSSYILLYGFTAGHDGRMIHGMAYRQRGFN